MVSSPLFLWLSPQTLGSFLIQIHKSELSPRLKTVSLHTPLYLHTSSPVFHWMLWAPRNHPSLPLSKVTGWYKGEISHLCVGGGPARRMQSFGYLIWTFSGDSKAQADGSPSMCLLAQTFTSEGIRDSLFWNKIWVTMPENTDLGYPKFQAPKW